MRLLRKGKTKKLSDHINQYEIDCKCTNPRCFYTLIHPVTLHCFEKLRTLAGNKSILINSAFRCQHHNASDQVKGVEHSKHCLGYALDLVPPKGMDIYKFADYAKDAGFDVVIIYSEKGFIHCHNNLLEE